MFHSPLCPCFALTLLAPNFIRFFLLRTLPAQPTFETVPLIIQLMSYVYSTTWSQSLINLLPQVVSSSFTYVNLWTYCCQSLSPLYFPTGALCQSHWPSCLCLLHYVGNWAYYSEQCKKSTTPEGVKIGRTSQVKVVNSEQEQADILVVVCKTNFTMCCCGRGQAFA